MASPFRYFRKHTKVFLAVAAVLAIFIFVVGDAIQGSASSGDAGDATATVATWNGGKLNAGQLQSLISQRMLTDQFLGTVFATGGGQSEYDIPQHIPQLRLTRQESNQIEGVVVSTEVLASLARQAGMSVSDSLINHYIEEMGLRRVSGEQVVQILGNIGQGNERANESIVFNTLRKMLLAYFYRRTFDDASLVVLPQERWADWRKVNERISIEAAVLPTEKFIAEVPEPTDAQISAFYEQHKDADPGRYAVEGGRELPLPDPGFAVPRRMRVQYLLGSSTQRSEQMLEKVTEEEIKDYYERNKRLEFTKMGLPGEDAFGTPEGESAAATPPGDTASPEGGEAAGGADAAGDGGSAENSAATPAQPPAEEGAAEGAAAADEPAATPAAPSDGSQAPAESEAAPADPAANEAAAPPAEGDAADESETSSRLKARSPFQLVAFQQPSEDAANENSLRAAPAEEAAPAGEAESAETEAQPAAAEESKSPSQPAASPAEDTPAGQPAAEGEAPPTGAAGRGIDPAAALPADDDAEYEPLENVREEIRKKLATQKAVEELERIMGEATAELQTEFSQYTTRVAAAQDAKRKPPAPPATLTDLNWLANKHGLTYEKTTPLTIRELFDTAVGKAVDTASMRVTVTQAADQSLELFEPMLAREIEGDWYLVTKIEDTPRRIPPLKEVRDQVVAAWKRAEAAKLAEKKAKELAAEVTKSGGPFDQFFFAERGFEVVKPTALFSWRSYPAGQVGTGRPPILSEVPELKNVGENFMQAAFALEGKEAVAVTNHDRSAAYVIRLDRRQYSEEDLRNLFLKEEGSWQGRYDMLLEHRAIFNGVVDNEILEERGQFKWDEEWLEAQAERMQQRNS